MKAILIRHTGIVILFVVAFSQTACNWNKEKDLSAYVDPFIGTVGSGNTFPGPTYPYGMVQLGPHLRLEAEGESGTIYGFSHTHLSGGAGGGSGVPGDIMFMPTIDHSQKQEGLATVHQSAFSHQNEQASPGYYQVKLDDYDINVELTTTLRTGLHRYTFPQSDEAGVVLKLGKGDLSINGDEISGHHNNKVFFVAKFSKKFEKVAFTNEEKFVEDGESISGDRVNGYFTFRTHEGEEILLKVGISMVSVEGARANLEAELSAWDFEGVRSEASLAWNEELAKIVVEGGSESDRTIFYTSLYHSLLHPNISMDVDRKYKSTNGKIYTAEDFDHYTTFSLWDTFRALHPLYTIINQQRTSHFIQTFLERYDHTGRMLIMEFQGEEGEQAPMIGYHSLSVIADAYVKGIRDFDVPLAYEAMKKLADGNARQCQQLYRDYGFIPADLKGQSVSRTLEYSYDDWCLSQIAKDLNEKDFQYYSQRGDFYKNVFSKEENFMVGRKSNFQFVSGFDPMETINHYTEANAYQYSTFVPHDIDGLMELMGGDAQLNHWLDDCFSTQTDYSKINVRDVTGLIGQYAHGNEPSHHIAYLYNFAGKPWKTQQMVRQILSELYTDQTNGIDGNEDCGQMSAWYVMSAMGFYSVTPGMDYYVIGSPIFDKVTLNLENGNTFVINAQNNSEENVYIQSAKLNGKSYSNTYLKHQDIMNGGEITFEMGNNPNKSWGAAKENRPYSARKEFKYAKTPTIDFPDILFSESTTIALSSEEKGAKIYYTLDGSSPTDNSIRYTKPICINQESLLKTVSYVDGILPSYPTAVHFSKIETLEAVAVSGLKQGIIYQYKEGDMMNTRAMKNLPVLETGLLKTFHVDAIKDERQFGYHLKGYLNVPESGIYTFSLEANDGAVLFLNDKMIIDNDGGHRSQKLDTKIALKKGWHPIQVDYFQQGLAKNLIVTWEGPGVKHQEIPAEVLYHKE